jgi:hypothetical protein
MPTDTPAPQVGIEVPVVVYGVDLQFYKIVEIPSFEANGETYYPNPGYIMIDVFADNKNGKSYTVANWPMDPSLGAVTVTTSSGLQVLWSFSNYMLNPGDAGNVDWIFAIPEGEVVVAINLPGGIVVDLTSLLGQFQSQNG